MKMLKLTAPGAGNQVVYVNSAYITTIMATDSGGCIIFLCGGDTQSVRETLDTVIDILKVAFE